MTELRELHNEWRTLNAKCRGREPDDALLDVREALEWHIAETRGGAAFKLQLALALMGDGQGIIAALVRSAYRDCLRN